MEEYFRNSRSPPSSGQVLPIQVHQERSLHTSFRVNGKYWPTMDASLQNNKQRSTGRKQRVYGTNLVSTLPTPRMEMTMLAIRWSNPTCQGNSGEAKILSIDFRHQICTHLMLRWLVWKLFRRRRSLCPNFKGSTSIFNSSRMKEGGRVCERLLISAMIRSGFGIGMIACCHSFLFG